MIGAKLTDRHTIRLAQAQPGDPEPSEWFWWVVDESDQRVCHQTKIVVVGELDDSDLEQAYGAAVQRLGDQATGLVPFHDLEWNPLGLSS